MMWTVLSAIIVATFVSEDLTCITTGLLIARGQLHPIVGIIGCLAGIYLGDLGLWLIGRLLRRGLLDRPWIAKRLPSDRLHALAQWFDDKGWRVIVASRFMPGTRVALYIASGLLGRKGGRFAFWTLVAACLWTPLVVGSVAWWGESAIRPIEAILGRQWLALAVGAAGFWLLFGLLRKLSSPMSWSNLSVRVQRWKRYEFWPSWLFYAPLVPYFLYLTIRHRGMTTLTAVNPGIPHSGVVGESKCGILSKLPPEWVVPSALIEPGDPEHRLAQLRAVMHERSWAFPLILKPDSGQRGVGVRRVEGWPAVQAYIKQQSAAILAQTYHAGPCEAGIFYYRLPGHARGRLFSITDKVFPVVIGDGRSTLKALIDRHPRYRLQRDVYFARHATQLNWVPAMGESFQLALAGNHCQGTMFRDAAQLRTPELELVIDSVARRFEGFYLGRFDVRYRDVEEFKSGKGWSIVELNGVTSESTNLYDPSWSLMDAYRMLARQWQLTFHIGSLNRADGHVPTPFRELVSNVFNYYRLREGTLLSD